MRLDKKYFICLYLDLVEFHCKNDQFAFYKLFNFILMPNSAETLSPSESPNNMLCQLLHLCFAYDPENPNCLCAQNTGTIEKREIAKKKSNQIQTTQN